MVVELLVVRLLLAPDAEEAVPAPGDHHHPHPRVDARLVEGLGHLQHGLAPEGIALVGPVDGEPGDLVPDLEEDVGVGHGATPSAVG
jgi:hypothetical protein